MSPFLSTDKPTEDGAINTVSKVDKFDDTQELLNGNAHATRASEPGIICFGLSMLFQRFEKS